MFNIVVIVVEIIQYLYSSCKEDVTWFSFRSYDSNKSLKNLPNGSKWYQQDVT